MKRYCFDGAMILGLAFLVTWLGGSFDHGFLIGLGCLIVEKLNALEDRTRD